MDTDTVPAPIAPADIRFRGIRRNKNGKYQTQLRVHGTKRSFGTYGTAEEAARAHDRAAQAHLGGAAVLNYIDNRLNPFRLSLRGKKTSAFRGVYFETKRKAFRASVRIGDRRLSIGPFKNEEGAAMAYDRLVKEKMPTTGILNFLPDGSLNPDRHNRRREQEPPGSAADNTEAREGDEEDEEEEEEGEGMPHKLRRLNEDHIIDLTDDEPMQVIAPSASSSATRPPRPVSVRAMSSTGGGRASAQSAAFNGRRAMPAVGGGGPEGSTQCLSLSAHPLLPTGRAVPAPAALPLPPSVNVEASVAGPSSSSSSSAAQSMGGNGLKMTPTRATALLGAEAFKRLAICEEGSDQMERLQRLVELLPQLHREARGNATSSSSFALSDNRTFDLQAFLLISVCPRYTAEELKANQPRLDDVMQMATCLVRLS